MLKESYKKLVIMALPAIAVSVLAACGGGNAGVSPAPQPLTSQPPASNPNTTTVSAGANAATAPSVQMGSASVSVSVPGGTGSATLQITGSAAAPTGVSPLSRSRKIIGGATPMSILPPTASVVGYVKITATSGTIAFGQTPSFSFTVPNNLGQFYLAALAPNGEAWIAPIVGPVNASGNTVDLQGVSAQMSVTPGQTYTFALFQDLAGPQPTSPPGSVNVSASNGATVTSDGLTLALSNSTGSNGADFSLYYQLSSYQSVAQVFAPPDLSSWPEFSTVETIDLQNPNTFAVNFGSTPAITLQSLPSGSSACDVDVLAQNQATSANTWQMVFGPSPVANGQVVFPAQSATQTPVLSSIPANGSMIFDIVCE